MKNHQEIQFPIDGKEHKAIIEWWYYNGHLWDKKGNHYSYMNCLFRADLKKVNLPYLQKIPVKENSRYFHFAHSVVSDIKHQKNYKELQNISMLSRDSFLRPLMFANYIDPLIIRGFANNEIAETSHLNYRMKTEYLDLTLESEKAPLLVGGDGYISVCERESYYYSLTSMKTKGVINIDNKIIEVEGKSWMDHQWADCAYKNDIWTWFALQLDNGMELMCVEYRDGHNKECVVSLIDANGKQSHFKKLVLTPGKDVWHSSKTKAQYPLSWELEIPEANIKLYVRSIMPDQEMIYGAINYWEGPLEIKAEVEGKEVAGWGFMELVGYSSDYNFIFLQGKEINREIWRRVKQSRKWISQKVGHRFKLFGWGKD